MEKVTCKDTWHSAGHIGNATYMMALIQERGTWIGLLEGGVRLGS